MDNFYIFMAEIIAQELSAVTDPLLLSIYLKAILAQRCKIGGAIKGTCKECLFQGHYCRELYQINKDELRIFNDEEEL